MSTIGQGRIVAWEGGSLWIFRTSSFAGPGMHATDFHSHHAIQATLALDGRFELRTPDSRMRGDAVAVAADARHLFEAEGLVAIVFVEPESRSGRAMSRALFAGSPLASIPRDRLGDLIDRLRAAFGDPAADDAAVAEIGRSVVARLAGNLAADTPDHRVRKMIAFAAGAIDRPLSLADVATVAGLSSGRARHLFVEQTGLPFRTYLLWLRVTKAVEVFAAGRSLTEAAHEAGFADSAHLSRTFRRMFGLTAASLRIE
ncbi:MAG: helix-turn-helix transcriptional regulator [Alphaproteobacteria bacterium]|nr:helix-turn-helix transcriptional regulator [Alphaproteobacteria bacterium]